VLEGLSLGFGVLLVVGLPVFATDEGLPAAIGSGAANHVMGFRNFSQPNINKR